MFFRNQPRNQLERYRILLQKIGSLSKLFSESEIPALQYRAAENIFCKAFEASNHSRSDMAIDASKGGVGLGIKTFLNKSGRTYQKIAEFNKKNPVYSRLQSEPEDLVDLISKLRNKRIDLSQSTYEVDEFLYHCVARKQGKFLVFEKNMSRINTDAISITQTTDKSVEFNDSLDNYRFNFSKSTLFKQFITSNVFEFDVKILEDPYQFLDTLEGVVGEEAVGVVYLPLYSVRGSEKYVAERSGLNQWNAGGRPRANKEVYIRIPAWIHRVFQGFFPARGTSFNLKLPNGEVLSAGVFQDGGKALMSNPNTDLGDWLIDEVLKVESGQIVTYDLLEEIGIDTLEVRKIDENNFEIDFKKIGKFESFKEDNAQ
jgi:hypothetical protein